MGHVTTSACPATFDDEDTLLQSSLKLGRPCATCVKSLKGRDCAWVDMFMSVFIQVEDILNSDVHVTLYRDKFL